MSIFSKIIGAAAPIVGGIFGGPAGAALGGIVGGVLNPMQASTAQPGTGMIYPAMQTLSALPAVGVAAAGAAARFGRGAIALCRRYPQWCSTIGGTAAVTALLAEGKLPMPRRRRGRGLSGRDLRGFRRTARLMRQVAGSIGLRRGGGRKGSTSSTMITQN